jgi:hypothetical protein
LLFGSQRVQETVATGGFGDDLGARINELFWIRFERQAFHLLGFEEADGVIHFRLLAFAELGPEPAELAEKTPSSSGAALRPP